MIQKELDEFVEQNRTTVYGDMGVEIPYSKKQDFAEFIKKYNSELVHREEQPPAFLCLDRDNNIYDLQELKEDYARAFSERATLKEAQMRNKA